MLVNVSIMIRADWHTNFGNGAAFRRRTMRLVDADLAPIYLNEGACEQIKSMPTIDPVHAAGACYCGECGYCIHQPGLKSVEWICIEWHNYCDCGPKIVAPNDFCNYGKRKEN